MKKALLFILAAVICCCSVSCNEVPTTPTPSANSTSLPTNTALPTIEPTPTYIPTPTPTMEEIIEDVDYEVYVDPLLLEPDSPDQLPHIPAKSAAEFNYFMFYMLGLGLPEKRTDVAQTLKYSFLDKNYDLEYVETLNDERMPEKDRLIDVYKTEDGKVFFYILRSDGRVLRYYSNEKNEPMRDYTVEIAALKAMESLESIYGKGRLDDYIFENISSRQGGKYTFRYTRVINGYECPFDSVSIDIDYRGEVTGVYSIQLGEFDGLENKITPKRVEKAIDYLKTLMKENYEITNKNNLRLYYDHYNGVAYVEALVRPIGGYANTYYVNLY